MKETSIFPAQKLSASKKNDEWRERCVDYIIGMGETFPSSSNKTSFDEMQSYYDLYNSIYNEEDLKYVVDPFKQDDGFPASPQDFNIIKPKIDLLLGEETKMPFNFRVIRTSDNAASEVQDKMKKMITDYMMASVLADMDPEKAAEFQEKIQTGELMPPEQISDFMSKSYKDTAEETAYHSINYLKEKLGLGHEFMKGFKDLLISAKEVYYTGIVNGEPHLERVNPVYFAHDNTPDLEFIEDGSWACRRMRMSYTEIYDRLYDKMDEKQLNKLLEVATGENPSVNRYGKMTSSANDYNHMNMKSVSGPDDHSITDANSLNMWHACWKSYRKVGFVKTVDEYGEVQEAMVSEDYMKTGLEISIEWKWIIEVWEGYRIAEDIYVAIKPMDYQYVSAGNPNAQKLPYSGVIYNSTNTKPKSLVSIMKPLQYMYIIIWYRLELALARDKGKVINMDITQIPKSMNIDPSKWMHYLSAIGVNFINPYEEGWDIPGREGGKPSQFNQITALDLTMANVIDQYINLMAKIEDMAGEISGVSKQRAGSISTQELVGNVDRAVIQSAHITEPIFWMHSQAKKNALRMLLNTAKEAWRESGKTSLQYVMNDATRAFLSISEKFLYEDMDIFVSDSTKDMQNLETIKNLYQPAMQNGATLLDVAEIMTLDNIQAIKSKLSDIEQNRIKMQQAAADQENQRQLQVVQAQNEVKQQEIAMKQQEMELDKYKIDVDSQTKITVAEIGAYKGQESLDADANGVPDVMEIADMSLKQRQHEADVMDKEMQRSQKEREAELKHRVEKEKISSQREIEKSKASIEKDKLALENKKLEYQKQIQEMKDKAAMERERLKAKTAIKNKVSGQK